MDERVLEKYNIMSLHYFNSTLDENGVLSWSPTLTTAALLLVYLNSLPDILENVWHCVGPLIFNSGVLAAQHPALVDAFSKS